VIRWEDPALGEGIASAYLGLLSLLWLALFFSAGRWGRSWRLSRGANEDEQADLPPITVAVPARDEAATIADCVKGVLASEAVALELVVVDDQSSDGTAELALQAGDADPRLQVCQGEPLPEGWAGKPWALSQAAAYAAHDYLLFLDADVQLHPQAIRSALSHMRQQDLDLLSLFGSWKLVGFWEGVVIPVVGWLVRGATQLDAVNDPAKPEAFANGQFIMVRRKSYEALGGHQSVRAEVLEDVKLARTFKQNAKRIHALHAPWAFHARLYRSLREIVAGYVKNFYEGMGRQPLVAAGLALFILVGTLLPFAVFFGGLLARLALSWNLLDWPWLLWSGLVCLLIVGFRWRQERADGRSGLYAPTHPLGNIVLVWIVLRSMMSVEVSWKGRRFRDGRATHDDA